MQFERISLLKPMPGHLLLWQGQRQMGNGEWQTDNGTHFTVH